MYYIVSGYKIYGEIHHMSPHNNREKRVGETVVINKSLSINRVSTAGVGVILQQKRHETPLETDNSVH